MRHLGFLYRQYHFNLNKSWDGWKENSTPLQLINPPNECRIYASVNLASLGSSNGLAPVRHQAITWTNAELMLIGPLAANLSEIRIKILDFSLMMT